MVATAPFPPSAPARQDRSVTGASRFLLYSHDAVGLGHLRRNLNIAAEIIRDRQAASVLVVTGAEDVDALRPPEGVDVLRLPGLRKLDNGTYAARRLSVTTDELHDLRAGLLATAVEQYLPDVLLADKHAAGARGELLPALRRLRAGGGRAVLGLRDVLDEPGRARREWASSGTVRHIVDLYDGVLVYGQRDVLDPLAASALPNEVRRRTQFCGYVAAPSPVRLPTKRPRPVVLAMTGGGEDGGPLLQAFLAAATGAGWDATAVTGPSAPPDEQAALERRAARGGVRLVRSVPRLGSRLGDVDAVVCMGGYNTLVEVLAAGVPTVCVPRVVPRTEQLIRARAFAARDLIRLLEPAEVDPARLRREIDEAVRTDRGALHDRVRACIDFGGAGRAAAALLDQADQASAGRLAMVAR